MELKPRAYTLRRRAEKQDATRQRIVGATVDLHREVGPAQTTISAVAERAGVQRHTVYRHFPDEATLFKACAGHFLATHPPPDTRVWGAIADPASRLRLGLTELYAYYSAHEQMITSVLRDSAVMPVGGGFRALHDAAFQSLVSARRGGRRRRGFSAAMRLATDFRTWQALGPPAGLSPSEAADLVCRMLHNL